MPDVQRELAAFLIELALQHRREIRETFMRGISAGVMLFLVFDLFIAPWLRKALGITP